MTADQSFLGYFFAASPVVKSVLVILVIASVVSWTYIFQRAFFFKRSANRMDAFEETLWRDKDFSAHYDQIRGRATVGVESIFKAALQAFVRAREASEAPEAIMQAVGRAMRVANVRELDKFELHLPFLATVGSVSPYVGLFGTVWGIMMAFHGLSEAQQATIAMVAPGISEALIATAMGLFAAIPAVIAYNRYASKIDSVANRFDAFQEELTMTLSRSLHLSIRSGDSHG
jgi:biopolymer transport protein TolQ